MLLSCLVFLNGWVTLKDAVTKQTLFLQVFFQGVTLSLRLLQNDNIYLERLQNAASFTS